MVNCRFHGFFICENFVAAEWAGDLFLNVKSDMFFNEIFISEVLSRTRQYFTNYFTLKNFIHHLRWGLDPRFRATFHTIYTKLLNTLMTICLKKVFCIIFINSRSLVPQRLNRNLSTSQLTNYRIKNNSIAMTTDHLLSIFVHCASFKCFANLLFCRC